jgi:hypothetical protein
MKLKKIIYIIRYPFDKHRAMKEFRKILDNYYKSKPIKSMSDFEEYANYRKQQDYDDIFKYVILLVVFMAIVVFAVVTI